MGYLFTLLIVSFDTQSVLKFHEFPVVLGAVGGLLHMAFQSSPYPSVL